MLGDLPEDNAIPISDLGLSKKQLDLAFNFIKTGDLPSDLSTTDCAALLRFANFLNHPSFMDEIYKQLNNLPLEKKNFLSLPFELGIQWAKARPTNECVIFLSSFEEKDSLIENIGLELINKGHLKVSDFKNFDQVKITVDPSRIQNLYLSRWKQLTPEAFKKIVDACPNAVTLKVPRRFTDQHLAHIKKLSNLQTLNLFWCDQITNDGLAHLKELKNLQSLNLEDCGAITDDGLAHLKELKNLQTLNLSGCDQIRSEGLAHLKELKNLQTLNLFGCDQITNDGLEHLNELKNLQTLNLTWCRQITNDGLEHLNELPSLQTLYLSGCNQITNDGLEHLNELKNLQRLNLNGCREISNDGLAHLKELPSLQTLYLSGCNQITHEAKNELQQLLPQLRIIG